MSRQWSTQRLRDIPMMPVEMPMNPEPLSQTQMQKELRARKLRALDCLLLGVVIFMFSSIATPGAKMMPPIVRDASGRPVLDAHGRMMHKPTLGYYVTIALMPWNVGMEIGMGLFVAAGVVRFRRPRSAVVSGGASA